MKFNDLNLRARNSKSRVGRGIAAGQGKTAGRGTKGYGSRTGSTRRPGFEGGQNPLMQRLPKLRGFKSPHLKAELIYLSDLKKVKGTIDNFSVFEVGLSSSPYVVVKLVGTGTVEGKHTVRLQAATTSALAAVIKAGGSFTVTERVKREAIVKEDDK